MSLQQKSDIKSTLITELRARSYLLLSGESLKLLQLDSNLYNHLTLIIYLMNEIIIYNSTSD